jgi:hypothetical protein
MRVFFVLAAALLAGCSEPSDLGPPPPPPSSLTSASASAGSAGAGGAGSAGGSAPGGGAGGSSDAGAADLLCAGDVAFWATGMAFVAPTPEPLAQALSALAYDPLSHPLSIVLAGASAKMGASATQDGGSGLAVFPPGEAPELVPAIIAAGGFETGAPQAVGYLRFVDAMGPVSIEVTGVTLKASTSSGCSTLLATLTAIIPASEGSKTLHLKGGASTIAELGGSDGGGEKDAGPPSWEIRALFSGETMAFDFTTLK